MYTSNTLNIENNAWTSYKTMQTTLINYLQ